MKTFDLLLIALSKLAGISNKKRKRVRQELIIDRYRKFAFQILESRIAMAFDLSPASPLSLGVYQPRYIETADFNRDGIADLVTTNRDSNTISIALGNGTGGFSVSTFDSIIALPSAVKTGDFNEDGTPDLAVGTKQAGLFQIAIMLGDGAGGFTSSLVDSSGNISMGLAVGDMNHDGHLDIVTANYGVGNSSDGISILLGTGNGSFTLGYSVTGTTGWDPFSISLSDINKDGNLDVMVPFYSTSSFKIYYGDGSGAISSSHSGNLNQNPTSIASADLNSDGIEDLVAVNSGSAFLSVYLGTVDGNFTTITAQSPKTSGGNAYALKLADINGDGKVDIITANPMSQNISFWFGKGDGSFQESTTLPPPNGGSFGSRDFVLADINGDGEFDIATANPESKSISVLLNNKAHRGSGVFGLPPTSPTSVNSGPKSVAIGDLNNDGFLDSVFSSSSTLNPTILLGTGSGSWNATSAVPPTFDSFSLAIKVADMNNDGFADLVASLEYNKIQVALGSGNGRFSSPLTAVAINGTPRTIDIGDFDNDGDPDVATANFDTGSVSILLNDGFGVLTLGGQPSSIGVGNSPYGIASGDIDGDGDLDLAVSVFETDRAQILLGNGAGTFSLGNTLVVGNGPTGIAIADITGDGKPDVVTANYLANTVTGLLGNGNGSFVRSADSLAGVFPIAISTVDFSGDSVLDVAVLNAGSNNVTLFKSTSLALLLKSASIPLNGTHPTGIVAAEINGDGRTDLLTSNNYSNNASLLLGRDVVYFEEAKGVPEIPLPNGSEKVLIADFNNDNRPDIVTVNSFASNVSVLLKNADGTFTQPANSPIAVGGAPHDLAIGDLNEDGKLDLVISSAIANEVSILIGDGAGGFQANVPLNVGFTQRAIDVVDINGDGKLDILAANQAAVGNVAIFIGNGSGGFSGNSNLAVGSIPRDLITANLNNDQLPDIITANFGNGSLSVLMSNEFGGFGSLISIPVGTQPQEVAAGDFNRDGSLDLIVACSGNGTIQYIASNGSGNFLPKQMIFSGGVPRGLSVSDTNSDGKLDVIFTNTSTDVVTVLLGNGDGSFSIGKSIAVGNDPSSVAATDLNSDGILDVVTANTSANSVSLRLGQSDRTTHFSVSVPDSVYLSGQPIKVTATALNTQGRTQSSYRGNVRILVDGIPTLLASPYVSGSTIPYKLADNGTLSFNLVLNGTGPHTIRVVDTLQPNVFGETTVTDNLVPKFNTKPLTVAFENNLYFYEISTAGAGLISTTISVINAPSWLSLTNTGIGRATLSGTPGDFDLGNFAVKIRCTTTSGISTDQDFAISVTGVDDAPTGTNKVISVDGNSFYTLTVSDFGFSDSNDSPSNIFTNIKITSLPSGGSLTFNNVAVTLNQIISVASLNSGMLKYVRNSTVVAPTSVNFQFAVQDNGSTNNGGINFDPTPNSISFRINPVIDYVESGTPSANGYTETGIWSPSALTGFLGSTTRFSNSANAVATWQIPISADGYYSVGFWNVAQSTNSKNAQFTVVHNNKTEVAKTIDLSVASSGFIVIGTYFFMKSTGGYLQLSQGTAVGNLRADAVRIVSTTAVNASPVITGPSVSTATGNAPFVFSTAAGNRISLWDEDGGPSNEIVSLQVTNGSVKLPTTTGISFLTGSNGDSSFSFQSSLGMLDNSFDGIVFQPAVDFYGQAVLTITLTDSGAYGTGGPKSVTKTFIINVQSPWFTVDNTDPQYSESGTWIASGASGYNGSSTRFSNSSNAVATWNTPNLSPGYYAVEFWNVAAPTNSKSANVTIVHNGITESPQTIDLSAGSSGFVGLGTYFFNGAAGEFVRLSQGTLTGNVRSDAIRFHRLVVPNAAPTASFPINLTIAGNAPYVFTKTNGTAITIKDADVGLSQVSVGFFLFNGRVTLSQTAGLTFLFGSPGSLDFTIKGTLADINNALEGSSFLPNLNYSGSASIMFFLNDLGNSGSGGAKETTTTFSFTVDPPKLYVNNEDAGYSENGIWTADSKVGYNSTTTRISSDPNATAKWNLPSSIPGYYTVGFWKVIDSANTTYAQATIVHNGITEPPQTIDLTGVSNGFVSLGTFFFNGMSAEYLQLSQGSIPGILRADAVYFNRTQINNVAATINGPISQTSTGNTPLIFSNTNTNSITVADADAGLAPIQLAISATNGLLTLPSTTGLTFIAGANGQANFTVRGTLTSLNTALNGLSFMPNLNYTGAASITLTANDLGNTGLGGAKTFTKSIAVTVNSPAFIVDNGTTGYIEAGSWSASGLLGFNSSSTRFGGAVNSAATWNAPSLAPGHYAVGFWKVANASNSKTAQVTIIHNGITEPAHTVDLSVGSSGFVELGTFFFSGAPGELVRLAQGTVAGSLRADAVRFNRMPVNNATPTITSPATQTVAGNTPIVFSTANTNAVNVADVDTGLAQIQLAFSANNGLLTLPSTAGLTFIAGANGQANFTVRGTLASLNAALNGLSFMPNLNFAGAAIVTLTANDLGNTGLGGAKTFTKSIAVTVNSPAFIVDNGTAGYVEGGAWSASGLLGFNNSSTRFGGAVNSTATWNAPSLVPGYYAVGFWKVANASNSKTAQVTIIHNGITEPAQTVDLSVGSSGFVELGTFFFSGAPGELVRLAQGTVAGSLRADAVRFNRMPVNNATPTITSPATQTVAGNTPLVFSTANTNAITVADVDTGLAQIQLALSATNGLLTLPSTAGLTFIAGANGQANFTVRGTLASLNAALKGLSFMPNLNFAGATTVTLTANDTGNTGLGGAKTFTKSIAVTVNSPTFIADNGTAGYVEGGAWSTSGLLGFNNSSTRFGGAVNSTATWNAPTLAPGNYAVAIWKVANASNSKTAKVTVVHNGITEPVQTIDLSVGTSGFVELGTFFFSGAPGELVRLAQGTVAGNLRADAVRFVKLP